MVKFNLVHVQKMGSGYKIVGSGKSFANYNDVRKFCHTHKLTIAKRTVTLKNGKHKDVPAKYTRGSV